MKHSLASEGARHPPFDLAFDDITARDAHAYVAADDGKHYRVGTSAPYQWFVLEDYSGPTFSEIGADSLWRRVSTFLEPGTLADGIKIYDSSGNEWATWDRSSGNFAISVGGAGSRALYKNCMVEQTQLGGVTASQFSAVSDSGDGNLHKIRADGVIQYGSGSTEQLRYPKSASDPAGTPADGSTYFNTALGMEMRYDATRVKWLSVAEVAFQIGGYYNVAAGAYYRSAGFVQMSAAVGFLASRNGAVVEIAYTRTDLDLATFEICADGAAIAELASLAVKGFSTTVNANFSANQVLSVRNKSGGNPTSGVSLWFKTRWRA